MKSTSIIFRKHVHGMAVISAIFLLVALSALGAAIAKVWSNTSVAVSQDLIGARAYQAARLGVDWGVYQVLKGACSGGDFCALCRTVSYASATPTSQSLSSLTGDLASFTVTVSCASGGAAFTEGGNSVWVYRITANACNQATGGACPNVTGAGVSSIGYTERQVSVTVTN